MELKLEYMKQSTITINIFFKHKNIFNDILNNVYIIFFL